MITFIYKLNVNVNETLKSLRSKKRIKTFTTQMYISLCISLDPSIFQSIWLNIVQLKYTRIPLEKK